MLPDYDSLAPATWAEALAALAAQPDVVPIAGGTNVVVGMRAGELRGRTLMDINRLPELHGIRVSDGHVVIGGGTTVAELLASPAITEHAYPLHQAAAAFANPLVRNRATIGGNLVDASPAADTYPPLLVLDAEVELVSLHGVRWLPLDQFVLGVNQTERRPEELLRSVRWPLAPERSAGLHHKLALRKGTACSVMSAAVRVDTDQLGRCTAARIALGAVAPRPIRAHEAEQSLVGESLTEVTIRRAAQLAGQACRPIDDVRSSAAYRRRVAEVVVRRLLTAVDLELKEGAQA
jgi:carbon-monoxide dehydrogenase medium subunit